MSLIYLNSHVMKIKDQSTHDLSSNQFKYLEREENSHLQRVDINVLNKKLNVAKRSNLYNNVLITLL